MGIEVEVTLNDTVIHSVTNPESNKDFKFYQEFKPIIHEASLNDLKQSNLVFKVYRLGASPSSPKQLYSVY
jgi:hypothetical protein